MTNSHYWKNIHSYWLAKGEELRMEFWDQFWPQLLATLIGVGLGIPAGIGLNHLIESRTERERKHKILLAISEELEFTREDLLIYKEDLEKKEWGFVLTILRDETWQSFKGGGELEWIKDPDLLNHLAEVYFLIKKTNFVSEKFFELIITEGATETVRIQQKGLIEGLNKTLGKIEELLNLI